MYLSKHLFVLASALAVAVSPALAENGVTDTEIVIGQFAATTLAFAFRFFGCHVVSFGSKVLLPSAKVYHYNSSLTIYY